MKNQLLVILFLLSVCEYNFCQNTTIQLKFDVITLKSEKSGIPETSSPNSGLFIMINEDCTAIVILDSSDVKLIRTFDFTDSKGILIKIGQNFVLFEGEISVHDNIGEIENKSVLFSAKKNTKLRVMAWDENKNEINPLFFLERYSRDKRK